MLGFTVINQLDVLVGGLWGSLAFPEWGALAKFFEANVGMLSLCVFLDCACFTDIKRTCLFACA